MTPSIARATLLRAAAVALVLAAALAVAAGVPAPGQADVASDRAAAKALRAQVAAESARIAATGAGLADAEQRLAALDGRVDAAQTQIKQTQDSLIRTRAQLTRLERRADAATATLRKNLVAAYETGTPDLVSIVINAGAFSDILEQADFYKRVRDNNGRILERARTAKQAAATEATKLEGMRGHYLTIAAAAERDRDQAAVVRSAILRRQQAQLEKRDGTSAKLATIRDRIERIEREQAAAARRVAAARTATQEAPPTTGAGNGAPSVSGNGVVDRVIAAANQIASTPYVWGGGHGSFQSSGYDCSGSVSYALAAGGLLSTPLDSTGFMSWGEPGPGRRITVYANAGHAYMYVDGRRFDTSALSGGGTRWTSEPRSNAGFVARHPPGL